MQPFSDVRVLDLTHVYAGPFATYQLAVLGAEVIKIEPPHCPDMTRDEGSSEALNDALTGIGYMAHAAGKKSLPLNLASTEGKEIFLKLVETADVVVQNYAGNALDRLGLGPDDLEKVNPRLIHCSMTGYGRTGPKSEHSAYDLVVQAYSGMMALNGWTPDAEPLRVGAPIIDYGTGSQAAFAIAAALFQRQKTGLGQRIDLSMTDASLMMLTAHVTETIASGAASRPFGNEQPGRPSNSVYETADGWLALAGYTVPQFSALMRVLGYDDRADEILGLPRADLVLDADADRERILSRIKDKSAAVWEELFNAARVPAARVRRIEETLVEEQVSSRSVLQECSPSSAKGGPDKLPVAAFSFVHGGPQISAPPPAFGADSHDILTELGLQDGEIQRLANLGKIVLGSRT
ncbi:CoA transferase [Pseudophaeobacter sp.]|uniref:CaiB/BaiF CoA transferase family protein n=1 Tax=Pseudophaeobacter sp. TaxID=1971739 RepID=UPI00329932D9